MNEIQNAYQFIIDSINDGVEFDMIESLDNESKLEFAEIYQTNIDCIPKAQSIMLPPFQLTRPVRLQNFLPVYVAHAVV